VFYLTGQQQEQNIDLQCKGRPGRVKMVSPLATLLRRRPVVEMVKLQVEAGATLPDRCQRIEKNTKKLFSNSARALEREFSAAELCRQP
jgi:hypothetical protein